jgi:flagellin
MVVQHNLTAMNASRQLKVTNTAQNKSINKLSSGFRINSAADDAAGLSISEKMRAQIRGLSQASRNAQDGISMAQTAEGALGEVTDMLKRMKEIAVEANTGTMTTEDKDSLQAEVNSLVKEIDRIAGSTKFNNKSLLDGSLNANILVGDNANAASKINITIGNMATSKLFEGKLSDVTIFADTANEAAVTNTLNISSEDSLAAIDDAIATVSATRSSIGAVQNRLEHTVNNLDNIVENTTAAESAIRDTDIAAEMVKYSNQSIIQQAGMSMLAQANQNAQNVLSLLR